HVERLRREHGSEDAHDEVERPIFQLVEIGRIAFLKRAVREALRSCALVPGLNEIAGDIDAQHVRSESRLWQCGRPIAASEIQNLEALSDPESLDDRLSALSHRLGDAREVAFL